MKTLKEMMDEWAELRIHADALEERIKSEVMDLAQTITTDKVRATYGIRRVSDALRVDKGGRGAYDYKAAVADLHPPDSVIDANMEHRWMKVVKSIKISDEVMRRFCSPGKPYVSLKLIKRREDV